MKFGVALGRLNPKRWLEATVEAERLGYESVWIPEHLVLPVAMSGSPRRGENHPPIPASTPVFDVFAMLAFLAAATTRIRLATHVYNAGLRHPFVTARAIATLDVLSRGRAIAGVGAGWLEEDWRAVGLDFASRGKRLDETLDVCIRLWTEETVEHHGVFFDFGSVMFEPKPVQRPHPPLLIGGMSAAALRRAARVGDGWVAMGGTPDSIRAAARETRELREGRPFEVTAGAGDTEVARWADAGVDRLIVAPWTRSGEAIDGLRRFASAHIP